MGSLTGCGGACATTRIRRAFVLGAGLGTRLRPITGRLPKPLVPVANRPLIAYAFDALIEAGIESIAVNTHHCPEAYGRAFPDARHRNVPIEFRHEPVLLETGGGIRNVANFLGDEPFLVYNGDLFSTIPVRAAIAHHLASGNEVTLVLRSGGGPRQISLDPATGKVTDIGNRISPDSIGTHVFTGIYVVEPSLLARIPAQTKISVIQPFIELVREEASLGGVVIDSGEWWDIGSRERYLAIHRQLAPGQLAPVPPAPWIDPSATIAPDARLLGATAVGPRTSIGRGAVVENSVVWCDVAIHSDARIENCVVLSGAEVSGEHVGETLFPT
jgi:NDP-sugar pyrophosphorylase family protein